MTIPLDERASLDRLRVLAALAAPSVQARPDLAATVLRRASQSRGQRRRYRLGATAGALVVGGAIAAAVFPGQGDYYRGYQPSGSMEPTLLMREQFIVGKKLTPKRKDLVVYRLTISGTDMDIPRRVIGMPGDTVSCPDDGSGRCSSVFVNGRPLAEPYLADGPGRPFPQSVVPPGMLFLMGDNRDAAEDSRWTGPVDREQIRGVLVRIVGQDGVQRPVPGAPIRPGPGGPDTVDPRGTVPPAPCGPVCGPTTTE